MAELNNENIADEEISRRSEKDLRVCLTAVITDANPGSMTVSCVPMLNERIMGGENRELLFEPMQELTDIPVADVSGVRLIPEPGQHGLLIFHDRDVTAYLADRALHDTPSARFHDYADALFLPFELAKENRPDPFITIEKGMVTIHTNVTIEGNADILGISSAVDHMSGPISGLTHIHMTIVGPTTPPIG